MLVWGQFGFRVVLGSGCNEMPGGGGGGILTAEAESDGGDDEVQLPEGARVRVRAPSRIWLRPGERMVMVGLVVLSFP